MKNFTDDINSRFGIEGEWLNPLKENFDNIEKRMKFYVDENIRLREENEYLKKENYKDLELAKLNKEYEELKEDLFRGYSISKDEENAISKYEKEHTNKMHPQKYKNGKLKWSGADFDYIFSSFELGVSGTCICESCLRKARKEAKGDEEKYEKLIKKYDAKFTFRYY